MRKIRESASSTQAQPTYQARVARYAIDQCEPQLRAIREGKIRFHALGNGNYPGEPIDERALPGVPSLGHWDAVGEQDWGLEPHRNEGIELVYLATGHCSFTLEQRRYELTAGHFTMTLPWMLHRLGSPTLGPGQLHWVILDVGVRAPRQGWQWPAWVTLLPEDRERLGRHLRKNSLPVRRVTPEIARAFEGLARSVEALQEPHRYSRLILHLNQLLLGVLDVLEAGTEAPSAATEAARRRVDAWLQSLQGDEHVAGQAWTLAAMARACGMGVTSLCAHTRALVNASPNAYLHFCRLDHAARLLRAQRERPITTLALELGFGSSQYFANGFHRRFRCSPSEYRKRG
jgi:AraC family L-rhamnose operon regulatory protein RhaS